MHTDVKDAEVVEETAQAEKDIRVRITSIDLSLNAERNWIARFEKDRIDKAAGDQDVLVNSHETYYGIRYQLRKRDSPFAWGVRRDEFRKQQTGRVLF